MVCGAAVISPGSWSRSLKNFSAQPLAPPDAFCVGSFRLFDMNLTFPRILIGLRPGITSPAQRLSRPERRVAAQRGDGLRQLGHVELLQLPHDLFHPLARLRL